MLILEMVKYREKSLSSTLICNRPGSKEPKQKSSDSHGGAQVWIALVSSVAGH